MERPVGVPDAATFNETDGVFELGATKGGARHGAFTTWTASGTKKSELRYKDGVLHGPFRAYYATGELEREGTYRAGELHGVVVVHHLAGQKSELLDGVVAPNVARSELEYASGRLVATRHFDKDKVRVARDGAALPELPRGVPSLAGFDQNARQWFHGPTDADGKRSGLWMWWSEDGTLVEESEFRDGRRDGVCRRYASTGALVEEGSFADDAMSGTWSFYDPSDGKLSRKADYDDGLFHGSVIDFGKDGRSKTRVEYDAGKKTGQYLARADKAKYAGGKIRVENGQFIDDVAVGRWQLLDKALQPVGTVDFGLPRGEDDVVASQALDDAPRDEAAWRELADKLKDDRMMGESLVASARAAAEAQDVAVLRVRLEDETAPLSTQWAHDLAEDACVRGKEKLAPLVHALIAGAEPSRVLEGIALRLDALKRTRAALDLVNAALLLNEGRASLIALRGRFHVRLGEADRARRDVDRLAAVDDEAARALDCTVAALFPRFDFWPASFSTEHASPRRAVALVRDLSAIQQMIQKYATRYEALRRRALTHVDGIMPWAPPDASPLLPIGDVALERTTIDVGGRVVDVDELVPDDDGDLPTLLAWLRASFAAVCWLCYACGSDRPTLSRSLVVPRTFSQVAGTIIERAEELRAGRAPRFSFCEVPADELPPTVVEIARLEYEESAACFTWLTDPTAPSPFATTLRPAPPALPRG